MPGTSINSTLIPLRAVLSLIERPNLAAALGMAPPTNSPLEIGKRMIRAALHNAAIKRGKGE